jgi:hypothetical protein
MGPKFEVPMTICAGEVVPRLLRPNHVSACRHYSASHRGQAVIEFGALPRARRGVRMLGMFACWQPGPDLLATRA